MTKFVIIDDVLPENDRNIISEYIYVQQNLINVFEEFYKFNSNPSHEKLINIAGKYFDMSKAVGYEMWSNKQALGKHIDKDERRAKNGILSYPICSIVYYPIIENLVGGLLCMDDLTITPKQNRAVIFGPRVLHWAEKFTGKRLAIAINPFDYDTRGKKHEVRYR
jgi:hypothetical protein